MDAATTPPLGRRFTEHEFTLLGLLTSPQIDSSATEQIIGLVTKFTFAGDPAMPMSAAIGSAVEAWQALSNLLSICPYKERIALMTIIDERLSYEGTYETEEPIPQQRLDQAEALQALMDKEIGRLRWCIRMPPELSMIGLRHLLPGMNLDERIAFISTMLDIADRPVITMNRRGRGYPQLPIRIDESDVPRLKQMLSECGEKLTELPPEETDDKEVATAHRLDWRGSAADLAVLYQCLLQAGFLDDKTTSYAHIAKHFDFGSHASDLAPILRTAYWRVGENLTYTSRVPMKALIEQLQEHFKYSK